MYCECVYGVFMYIMHKYANTQHMYVLCICVFVHYVLCICAFFVFLVFVYSAENHVIVKLHFCDFNHSKDQQRRHSKLCVTTDLTKLVILANLVKCEDRAGTI